MRLELFVAVFGHVWIGHKQINEVQNRIRSISDTRWECWIQWPCDQRLSDVHVQDFTRFCRVRSLWSTGLTYPIHNHFCYIVYSSLTVEDEVRQISRLIACFIFRVDYGNDLEKYLNFYMEARGAFIRLDYVQSALVQVRHNFSSHHNKYTGPYSYRRGLNFPIA